jgi:DNA (cytosine-5)-methyltransferase 1
MTHGSLFSGIGGFDLAAHWMGWDNIFHCEWNEFGQKVLKHHFPTSTSYNDITKTDFTIHRGEIDILTGGFPCQPYSTAGLRKGKADERHLFPEMLRAIKEIKPRWVIGENVRGLVSWNGGMVFNEVCDDLEREGYEVQPFLIPAAGVNAPHQRQRIWFVAYSNDKGRSGEFRKVQKENGEISERNNDAEFSNSSDGNATNSISIRLEHGKKGGNIHHSKGKTQGKGSEFTKSFKTNGNNGYVTNTNNKGCEWYREQPITKGEISFSSRFGGWDNFPTEPALCGRNDGLSKELDNITFSKWRKESIKGYGNAIVPQVAFELFKTIELFENS